MTENSQIKIALLLDGRPLADSQLADGQGQLRRDKLVWTLSPGDIALLQRALALSGEVTVFAFGRHLPREQLQLALAHGAQQAVFIGGPDWPSPPQAGVLAYALAAQLQEFALVLCADDNGLCCENAWLAALAQRLQRPYYNSLLDFSLDRGKLQFLRKLEKGGRQLASSALPAVCAVLPENTYAAPPSLRAQILAKEQPILEKNPSYYDCQKKAGVQEAVYWQPLPWHPALLEGAAAAASLPAKQRLQRLLAGSQQARGKARLDGSPAECAAGIVEYLVAEGLIKPK